MAAAKSCEVEHSTTFFSCREDWTGHFMRSFSSSLQLLMLSFKVFKKGLLLHPLILQSSLAFFLNRYCSPMRRKKDLCLIKKHLLWSILVLH